MSIFRGTLTGRADGALSDIRDKLFTPEASDTAGSFGAKLGVVFVLNESGASIDVTLPGVPDPYGRPGPDVISVANGDLSMIAVGSPATLGAPIDIEFSSTSGVTAGSFRLDGSPISASSFEPDPPIVPADLDESFEFAGGWPGTVANTNPNPTFTTASLDDGFENADGWPGT